MKPKTRSCFCAMSARVVTCWRPLVPVVICTRLHFRSLSAQERAAQLEAERQRAAHAMVAHHGQRTNNSFKVEQQRLDRNGVQAEAAAADPKDVAEGIQLAQERIKDAAKSSDVGRSKEGLTEWDLVEAIRGVNPDALVVSTAYIGALVGSVSCS